MNVRELIEELRRYDDDDEVIVWFVWNDESVVDEVVNTVRNGRAIQLNTATVYEQ